MTNPCINNELRKNRCGVSAIKWMEMRDGEILAQGEAGREASMRSKIRSRSDNTTTVRWKAIT